MTFISGDIEKAVEILSNEDLVAIPTETVYGLAGNIFSEVAIKKIFAMKQRPLFNPLIVHTYSFEKVESYVKEMPPKAKKLAEAFWPGSLTMVLNKNEVIPHLITAGKDTVAVRIPDHPIISALLKRLDFPLAAPSANPFGNISPTRPEHVKSYFEGKLTMVLDGGECKNGIESTIIGFEEGEPVLYRLGSLAVEEIEKVVGKVIIRNKKEKAPDAPGMLARHYAPETRTYLVDDVKAFIDQFSNKRIGVLSLNTELTDAQIKACIVLSKTGNLKEAASKLYSSMHELDKLNLDMIVAERMPAKELGLSINDRLERATKQK